MTTHKRWLLAGDSIQTYVFADGVPGDTTAMLAHRVPEICNVSIQNISAGGNRMSNGGVPGFGLEGNLNMIKYIMGGAKADGIICTLGTNDWDALNVSGIGFIQAYRSFINYCWSTLGLKVVCMSPIWRANGGENRVKADGTFKLSHYQDWVTGVAQETGMPWIDGKLTGITIDDTFDGTHLNAQGHIKVGDFIISKMQAMGNW